MEICGGQTHAIVRFGIDRLLPPEVTLVHGPGCPVCVTPVDDHRPGDGDRRRAGASRCAPSATCCACRAARSDLLASRAAGGDVRVVYSPLDALAPGAAQPDRQVVFFAVGFETTAPADAAAVRQAAGAGLGNFCLLCVARAGAAGDGGDPRRARLPGPGFPRRRPRLYGDGAGRIPAAGGALPRAHRRDRLRAGRYPQRRPPCLRQLEPGRGSRTRTSARCGPTATRRPGRCWPRCSRWSPRTWRGIGEIPESGLGLRPAYAGFDAAGRFELARSRRRRTAASVAAARCCRGRLRADRCPAFATRCTPETPLGATMVSVGGRLRGLLPLPGCEPAWPWTSTCCPVPLESPTVLLAHGGGGRLMHQLLDRLFLPAFGMDGGRPLHDAAHWTTVHRAPPAAARVHHRHLRRAAAVLSRRRHRQRWPCTAR